MVEEKAIMLNEKPVNPLVQEALVGPYSQKWQKAMETEFDALTKSRARILTDQPTDKKVIGCRWILRKKYDS